MTIGLTWRRTARRIKRLNETVLGISPDYSDRPTPDFLTLSFSAFRSCSGVVLTEGSKLFLQPVQLGFQPTNLLIQSAFQFRAFGRAALRAFAENLRHRLNRLLFPGADLQRMDLKFRRQLPLRFVSFERGQGYSCLQLRTVSSPASFLSSDSSHSSGLLA
jgi:hypothetical protein